MLNPVRLQERTTHMLTLYSPEEARLFRHRASRTRLCVFLLFAFATLAAVLLCCFAGTRTALLFQWLAVGEFTLLGWTAILLYALVTRPSLAEASHMEAILASSPETRTGLLTLSGSFFAIPKSVTVCGASLDTGAETLSLSVDAARLDRLPAASFPAEVQTVRKFITAIRPLSPEEAAALSLPAPASADARNPRPHSPSLFRRVLSLLPMLIVWAMLSLLLWCWVFSWAMDAPPAQKITLFVNGAVTHGEQLAATLEEALPAGLRLVQVRPFSYAMMDGGPLRAADLYILPESDLDTWLDWFAPLPSDFGLPADRLILRNGIPVGLPVYSEDTCLSVAGSCIAYTDSFLPAGPWVLCFGNQSLHVPGNPAALDDAALAIAAKLLTLR